MEELQKRAPWENCIEELHGRTAQKSCMGELHRETELTYCKDKQQGRTAKKSYMEKLQKRAALKNCIEGLHGRTAKKMHARTEKKSCMGELQRRAVQENCKEELHGRTAWKNCKAYHCDSAKERLMLKSSVTNNYAFTIITTKVSPLGLPYFFKFQIRHFSNTNIPQNVTQTNDIPALNISCHSTKISALM